MQKYAQVIVDINYKKLDRPFTYQIPENMRDKIAPGSLVQIPFGRGKNLRKGYVIGFSDSTDLPPEKIREIAALPMQDSGFSEGDYGAFAVALAAWMKRQYGSTMTAALKTVLSSMKPGKPVQNKEVHLLLNEDEAKRQLDFYQKKHQVARERLLRALMDAPRQPYALVTGKLHITAATIRAMREKGILEVEVSNSLRNPVSFDHLERDEKVLSDAQQKIVDGVLTDFDSGRVQVSLIHGITGSGKTQVYIEIIREIVRRGRQAIMLIPEIALTYQTLLRFYRYFGNRVSVMNSSLSDSEKADQWERARRGEIDVIIGPRSALFTPFERPGMIVIDEEHETSYKNESMPKYQTRDVAIRIAKMRGAGVVLGSATPSLESYRHAKRGDYRLYELSERLTGGALPEVETIDLRRELREGNRSILSRRLASLIEDRLDRKEQTILFLNRRGYSGMVSCRACGYVFKCPHCDVALSLHRGGRMVCHYCGYEEPAAKVCPECGSPYVAGFKIGTEQVESTLKKMYPKARILRMDADTTRRKGSHERILSAFANEEADILIGTQMIVKGHDFPNVTLVGALLADLSLYVSDYRAAERTFQLLTQAAGRAGRGKVPGRVVIQTYQPDNYAIVYASRQDYAGFYEEEISYRSLLKYPPCEHMLSVQISSEDEDEALALCGDLRELIRRKDPELFVIGPAKGALSKLRDSYRYVLYVKNADYDRLVRTKDLVEAFMAYCSRRGLYSGGQVQFDFDPVNVY